MPRPSFFGKQKPEVLVFVRALSKEYRTKGIPLSLNHITKKLRAKFKALPPAPPVQEHVVKGKKGKPDRVLNYARADSLKLVVYRLCNSNGIWFGDPELNPSRMKDAPAKKKKA